MPDYLDPDEQKILIPLVNLSISRQEARIFLEQKQLDDLYKLKECVEQGYVPDDPRKVRNGMVPLELIELTRRSR